MLSRWLSVLGALALTVATLFASAADDPTDPAIVAQAVALGRDPVRIYEFVRDQIGYELYSTSLRGGRGVLYAKAGNSLDRASLLVALLRASGVTARYVQGTLDSTLNQQVIASLFAPRNQILGCPPPSAISNPYFSFLDNTINPHFWVEYGAANAAMDPTLRTNQLGQAYGTVGSRFTDIPAALRQKVTVRLVAESYNAAGALFGLGVGSATVLEQTFETAELYGKPISIGHFVSSRSLNGLTASANLHTYSPYLLVGDPRQDVRQHELIRGTDYQESLTNFPLSSIIITGLTLEVDAEDTSEQRQTYRKTLIDRIGIAARRNGGRITVPPGDLQATISEQDITTVNVLSGPQGSAVFPLLDTRLKAIQGEIAVLQPQLAALPVQGPLSPAQLAVMQEGARLGRSQSVVINELNTSAWARASDQFLDQLQTGYLVRGWYNRPRIIIGASRLNGGTLTYNLDLVKRDLRTISELGQRRDATLAFELLRGMVDSSLEGEILSDTSGQTAFDVIDVIRNSPDGLAFIGAPNLSALADLSISDAARALITEAVARGQLVMMPRKAVTLAGAARYGWLEYNPTTGETIGTFEDGTHGAFVDWVGTQLVNINYNEKIAEFCGRINGIGISAIIFTSGVLNGVASANDFRGSIKRSKADIGGALGQLTIGGGTPIGDILKYTVFDAYATFTDGSLFHPPPLPESAGLLLSFAKGLYDGFQFAAGWLKKNLPNDPEVYAYLGADLVNGVPGPVTPGAVADTRVTLLPEPFFYTNIAGAQLPGVYKFRVQNRGPASLTYALNTDQRTQGVEYQFSVDRISVSPGQTVEVGLCVLPRPPFPAPGTTIVVQPSATAITTGATANATVSLVVPAVTAVEIRTTPSALTLRPGASEMIDLTIQNVGNQAVANAPLTVAAAPGLTVTGLPASVNVAVGQTAAFRVTVAAAASTSFNAALAVAFRALETTKVLPVGIGTDAANCAIRAGAEASSSDRSGLATVLNELARLLNSLAGAPDNAVLKAATVARLDNLLNQLNVEPLTARRPAFQSARDALAAAAPGAVLAAINALGTELCTLNTALAQLPGEPFATYINPSAQTLLPGVAASYGIVIHNPSRVRTRTFRLTTSALPAGVTATINNPTVTLRPGYSTRTFDPGISEPFLTLTATGPLAPFAFEVIITAVDDPSNPRRLAASVTTRPELVALDNLTPSPAATAVGGIINLSARVFNTSNQTRTAQIYYNLFNAANRNVGFNLFGGEVLLSIGSALQTVNFVTPINTTGFPEGPYRIEAVLIDGSLQLQLNPTPARATFWVGSPISAKVTLSPSVLPPTTGTTTATLQISRDAEPNPRGTLLGSVQTTGRPQNMAILNNIVYVCGDTAITAVDVTDPANLVVRRTFGQAQLGTVGYLGTPCNITNNHLYVLYGRLNGNNTANFIPTNIAVYNLADPINPTLDTIKSLDRQDPGTFAVNGSTGTLTTQVFFYNPFSQFIFQYAGQVITLDLSDPTNPREVGQLFPPALSDPRLGSTNPVAQTLPINATLTYVASSTLATDPAVGVGRVVIANLSNPAAPSVASILEIPGTRLIHSMARLGNTVLLLGDTLGNYDAISGFTGFLTLTTLDISNPAVPVIRQTLTTQLRDKDGATVLALTNNTFVVGGATIGTKPALLLVDATNPAALRFVPYETAVSVFPQRNAGSFFYTLSTAGLSTYRLDTIPGPQLNARVEIPKGTGVTVVPGSFSLPPTNTIPGTDFDTYEWIQPVPNSITWSLNLTGLAPGNSKIAVGGGRIDFTLPTFGPGTFALSPAAIVTDQILAMTPNDRATQPGVATTYAVTVRNPTAIAQTFNLSVAGVAADWVSLPASVNVAANGTANVILTLTPNFRALAFLRQQFALSARTASGLEGSVAGSIYINQEASTGNNNNGLSYQLSPSLNPAAVSIGRFGQATTTLRIENTGNVAQDISLALFTPPGISASYSRNGFVVRPGRENAEEITISFSAFDFAASGPFQIFQQNIDISGTITLLPQGVTVALNPPTGGVTTPFTAVVTNSGTTTDTFDFAPAGGLGPIVSLNPTSLTLASKASANVTVTLTNASTLGAGATSFDVIATSRANPIVRARGRATINLPNRKGVLAALDPSPAATALVLSINNTGNIDDSYSVTVSQTTGTATATLRGLSVLPRLSLQGLGLGQLPVAASGQGTITLTVQSLSDPTVQASATATVGSTVQPPPPVVPPPVVVPPTPTANQAPVSNAGPNRDVPIRQLAALDGSLSRDPDSGPQALSYSWTLLSKPNQSQLATANINNATQAKASFTPDAFGSYLFRLTVSDGALTATSEVTLNCVNLPPISSAGLDISIRVGRTVILKGDQSFDPDNDRLTYSWRLLSAPAGSAVTTVRNSWNVQPYFLADLPGTYRFSLTVRDGLVESQPDLVDVTAYQTTPPASPVDPPALRSVFPAPLAGPIPSGNGLTVLWRVVSTARLSRLNEADINAGRFVPDTIGHYVLRREVFDGTTRSATNFVFASAAPCDTDADGVINDLDLALLIGLSSNAVTPEVLACSAPAPITIPDRPYFNAEPRLMQFTWQRGTPPPEPRTIFLDGDQVEYRTSVIGRGFTIPSPRVGTLPTNDRVTLTFSPGALAAGIYEDQVVLVAPGASQSIIVRVLLTVIDTPQLLVDQRPLVFRFTRGGALPPPQVLYVTATAKPIRFEAAITSGTWVMINPGVAQIPANLRIEVDPRTLAPGTYNGLIRVSAAEAANSPKEVPVTLIVD